jgi:hypothetical protein
LKIILPRVPPPSMIAAAAPYFNDCKAVDKGFCNFSKNQ